MKSVAESMNEMAEIILNLREENEELKTKINIAKRVIRRAGMMLACMDDLSEFNDGKCNEQVALEELNEGLAELDHKKVEEQND